MSNLKNKNKETNKEVNNISIVKEMIMSTRKIIKELQNCRLNAEKKAPLFHSVIDNHHDQDVTPLGLVIRVENDVAVAWGEQYDGTLLNDGGKCK